MDEQPWFQDIFETWDAAVSYQRIALLHYMEKQVPIRACEINCQRNFATGKLVYSVFVRPFLVSK
jgi:hypothetical protein